MAIACLIRYQIDPTKRDEFRQYAEAWTPIIARCGGDLVGYILPHEGKDDIAWALISLDTLADCEEYRARLRADLESRANFAFATEQGLIIREERTFLEAVGR